ncbi:M16 family metallopeptidase [Acidimangrovimonas pyrenivorans]|uniref:M16 family metallopeptidase n=1 Tax=Acidimangrovimonas pyrenivorans TaxID=2030798 RepID=A0ABV7AC69_9RHOB
MIPRIFSRPAHRLAHRLTLGLVTAVALALPALATVPVQAVTSPHGIKAWLVENHDLPFTALEIRFRGGSSLDAPGKRGAVNLMAGLLEEGAGDMNAQQFAAARDALAAHFRFNSSDDDVSISARFLSENRAKAIALLKQAIVHPRFDPDAIDRVRGQVISNIKSDAKDPNAIAGNTFYRLAFGSHPYGSSDQGTLESVKALTRQDMVDAHAATMARDRVYVAAAGDITPEQLGKLVDTLLDGLPAKGAPMPGPAKDLLTGGTTVVPFDTPQSVILFGEEGLKRHDPDFFPAYVMNEILGGGRFSARLMTEVREKRGLTYGVYSYLAPMDHAQLIMGSLASDNAKAGEAIKVIKQQWAKMAEDGVTKEELDAAKTYLTGSYPLRFDGNSRIARILVGMQMDHLPIDYIATRNKRMEAVTVADVNRVAKRLLKPENLRFVVVGKPVGVHSTDSDGAAASN